jgi:hypothetical protein
MAEAIDIQWKERQVTSGRRERYSMEGVTGDQWQKGKISNGRRER